MQNKLRESRRPTQHRLAEFGKQIELTQSETVERTQLEILEDYGLSIQTALNFEGSLPFDYPGLKGYEALAEIETSLKEISKKGAVPPGRFN